MHTLAPANNQGLNSEVVIPLKLILNNIMALIEDGDNILVKNLVAREFQRI